MNAFSTLKSNLLKRPVNLLLVISLVLTGLISGCVTNPFSDNYQTNIRADDPQAAKNLIIPPKDSKARIIRAQKVEPEHIKLLEDGYVLLGYAAFNGQSMSNDWMQEQAKQVQAEVVLYTAKHIGTRRGVTAMQTPEYYHVHHHTRRLGTSIKGLSSAHRGYSTYAGLRTEFIPYSIDEFAHNAGFYVQAKPPIFGGITQDLTREQKQLIEKNAGASVFAVVKKSPAFNANILAGDIITQVNQQPIVDAEDFEKTLLGLQDKAVTINVIRDGKPKKIIVTLNATGQIPSQQSKRTN